MSQTSDIQRALKLDWLTGLASSLAALLLVCIPWGPFHFEWPMIFPMALIAVLGALAGRLGVRLMGRGGAVIFGFGSGLLGSFLLSLAVILFFAKD